MPDSADAMTILETGEGHAARHGENPHDSADGPGEAEGTVAPCSLDELHYPIYIPLTAEQRAQLRHDLRQQCESEISFAGFLLGRKHAEMALTRRIGDVAGAPAWNLSGTAHDEALAITAALAHHQEAARLFAQDGVLVQVTNGPQGAGIRQISSPARLQGLLAEIAVRAGQDCDVARLFVRWDSEWLDDAACRVSRCPATTLAVRWWTWGAGRESVSLPESPACRC